MHKTKSCFVGFIFLNLMLLPKFGLPQSILDQYLHLGLDSNLVLRQKVFDLERSRIDLQRAKALFFPQASVHADYSLAEGGRTIDIPVGDLLNPVYSTLNELTSSNKFPQVQNQSVQFLPNNYQDSRVEVSLPVYNPVLGYNKRIQAEMIQTRQLRLNLYKRDLVNRIKQAYYQYLQSVNALVIYSNSMAIVRENLRYAGKLVKNNAATKEVELIAKTQVSQVETSIAEAEQKRQNSAAYFNFLLNRPLTAPILVDSGIVQSLDPPIQASAEIPANREELHVIKSAEKTLEINLKLDNSYKWPVINGFYHVGFQGYGYADLSKQFYQIGGLQLRWNLFQGNDNRYKVRQDMIDMASLRNQYDDSERQLLLQVTVALNAYQAAWAAMHSSQDEVTSSREVYRMVQSRFQQGQALPVELTDARTQMTNAEIKHSLAQLAVLSQAADLERVMATYPLDQTAP